MRPRPEAAAMPSRSLPLGTLSAVRALSVEADGLDGRITHLFAAERRVVAAGQEVYAAGEQLGDFYLVLEGWAALYQILEDGRRQILDFALPGSILGLTAPDAESRHSAEALTTLRLAVLPRRRLGELFTREPRLALYFVEALAEAVESTYEGLTDAGRRTAREAVAHLLFRLAQRHQRSPARPPAEALSLPLTLEHIGDALGLTAVHVCRMLRRLREDGVVAFRRGHLRILSPARLAAAAGVEMDAPGATPAGALHLRAGAPAS
jgi:CRP-like cAMP-binding protein